MPNKNIEAFNSAEQQLENLGHVGVNPFKLDELEPLPPTNNNTDKNYLNLLKRDLSYLLGCDGVLVLPHWEISRGASLEVLVAVKLEMPIYSLHNSQLEQVHLATDVSILPLIPSCL